MDLFELIAYGFLFGAFLLFNWVTQQAKRRRLERQRVALEKFRQQPGGLDAGDFGRPGPPGRTEPTTGPAPASHRKSASRSADALNQHGWGREPETVSYETLSHEVPLQYREEKPALPAAAPAAPAAPVRAREARRRPHPVLRTRRDLRNAVVAMTVLGPCRAMQPYEPAGVDVGPMPAPSLPRS